jgi:dienelactone hydrolase
MPSPYKIKRYIRPFKDAKENILDRARRGTFAHADCETVAKVMDGLVSLDRDAWARGFMSVARPWHERAEEAEARGDAKAAREAFMRAYAYYRLGRYPTTNSPAKRESYERSVASWLRAARYLDPPLERIEIPFDARPGEGNRVVGYLRRPKGAAKPPIVVTWGGIDGYKEDRIAEPLLQRGLAVLAIDNAGVGEAPIKGGNEGERYFDTVFDWVRARGDVDGSRLVILGASTGGYWAAKLAHTRSDILACSVNHGGCAHYAFTPQWIEKAQDGEYAYELAETLAYAFGRDGFEDWVEWSPNLSLVKQGVLEQRHVPLLCVNGKRDTTFPIEDHYLLFEYGDPKWGYFPDTGHMGRTPRTEGIINDWICGRLGLPRR